MLSLKVGTGTISALVYRPDGSALVALDVDHPTTRVRVFPLPDGHGKRSVAVLGTHLAISADGRRAAGVSFSRVREWALDGDGKTSHDPLGRTGFLYGVGYTADAAHVLVSGQGAQTPTDRRLVAWDAAAGRAVWTLECAAGQEIAAAAERVVTAGSGHLGFYRLKAGVLFVEAGRVVRDIPLPAGDVHRVRLSPDGSQVAVARGRTVFVWDAATGVEQFRLTGHKRTVRDVAFSPDGRLLATGGDDDRVKFWDALTGRTVATYGWRIGIVGSLAFAPDGLTCAAGGTKGRVVVWDVDE